MFDVQGIQGASIPNTPKPAGSQRPPVQSPLAFSGDGVSFSAEASNAAAIQQRILAASGQSEIRQDRVAEAKQQIEDGTHRLQQVVLQVASRVSKFVE